MKKKGFTLIELLVVIAIIALLLSILIPALRKARDQAMRVYCGGNIKQLLLGLIDYGNENNNRVPTSNGFWPWDVPYDVTNQILKGMGINVQDLKLRPGEDIPVQPVCYCPANMQQKRFRKTYWSYAIDTSQKTGYRIFGFAILWSAGWNGSGNRTILGPGNKKWVKRIDMPQASEREFVIDTTMSDDMPGNPKYPNGRFLSSTGGMPGQGSLDSTSHLVSDSKPMGGNIGFLDGHVEWRPFTDMVKRINTGPWWWW